MHTHGFFRCKKGPDGVKVYEMGATKVNFRKNHFFLLNITAPNASSKNTEDFVYSQHACGGTRLHSSQCSAIIAKSAKSTLPSPFKSDIRL